MTQAGGKKSSIASVSIMYVLKVRRLGQLLNSMSSTQSQTDDSHILTSAVSGIFTG